MKRTLTSVALLLALAPAFAACGGDDETPVATDPAGSGDQTSEPPAAPTPPTAVPAAPGPVAARNLPLVMDTGDGPQLCLGAVAESYPPQCGGPAIIGWDWAAQKPNFDKQGDIRWGTFAVTGTWDGTSFTVTDAIPGALYDPMPVDPPVLPEPSKDYTQAELEQIAADLGEDLPGATGSGYADDAGHVLIDVTYDDGTLQDYVDATYGDGVVVVNGALVDA